MLASVVFLAGPAGLEGLFTRWTRLDPQGWMAVLLIGLSSGIGYILWLWALKHTTPTRVTVFLSLSPITASLLGALILGETFTLGVFRRARRCCERAVACDKNERRLKRGEMKLGIAVRPMPDAGYETVTGSDGERGFLKWPS